MTAAYAGVEQPVLTAMTREAESNFSRGAKEFQNVTGAFFFFDTTQNNRPAIDSLRLGIMLNDPWRVGPLSGNFEFLGEVFGGGIFDGPGNIMTGASLVMRYNFVQPRARLVPYLQIGAGGVYTDIGEQESHGLISLTGRVQPARDWRRAPDVERSLVARDRGRLSPHLERGDQEAQFRHRFRWRKPRFRLLFLIGNL